MADSSRSEHFLFLSAVTYHGLLGGRTRILADQLAALGHRVTFVDMPSSRATLNRILGRGGDDEPRGSAEVIRLPPLPWELRRKSEWIERLWVRHAVSRLNDAVPNISETMLVVSTPWWLPVARGLQCRLRCYDYLDHVDVQAGPGRIERFRAWDEELIRACDVVTTVSEPLRAELSQRLSPERVFVVPNGVRSDWITGSVSPIARTELAAMPGRPIAGFLGALFEWIDFDLLAQTAQLLADVNFTFIGPRRRGVTLGDLEGLPNVRVLPPVPFEQVPRYVAAFDVCLIPFKQDLISISADPLKLYEYCALAKPVISTIQFQAVADAPITVAANADELAGAVVAEFRDDSPARRETRIAFARLHTWEQRARDFTAIIQRAKASR